MRSNTDVNTSLRLRAGMAAGLVAALLAVTGCTSGGETADETSAPTSEPSVSSAAPNEEQSQGANDEVDGASASPYGDGHGSGDGQGDGASDDNGEYVPASEDGPAKNVPVPTKPPMMAYDNPEGAKAAAAYFWDTYAYMNATGDTALMREMSADDCEVCTAFILHSEASTEIQGWAGYAPMDVEVAIVSPNHSTGNGWVVNQIISAPEGTTYWPEGEDVKSNSFPALESTPFEVHINFASEDDAWQVTYVALMEGAQ